MIANLQILFEVPALGLQLVIDGILIGAVFALAALRHVISRDPFISLLATFPKERT